jgi:beta-galactosidase
MKLGVCYYPEHWPAERWPVDAALMRVGGLSIVRIGEFAWAKMEPSEGEFNWNWLDQIIDILATEGLEVILGTPTATPPAWLVRAHEDVLPVDAEGRQRRFGSRRHYCANNPNYQAHTVRIVNTMAARYGSHPAVIGWQIDNEFGCHETIRCYCDNCALKFRLWLRERYRNIETLNSAWGTVFWSQTYTDWEEIAPPNLTVTEPNPSHVLDYYRFSSDSWVGYQQLQIDLLRQHADQQFITHNLMGNYPDLDYHATARQLDFVTWDSYPTGYAELQSQSLYRPEEPRPNFTFDAGDPDVTGFCHDLTRGLKQAPFWVMEQQCGNVNWSEFNTGVRPGIVRLWTWHALASGANAVLYFRWRATQFAQEQHHSGLLNHDGSPGVGYRDLLAMKTEQSEMTVISDEPHGAQIALLLDYDDLWAIQLQPHRKDFGYFRHHFIFYRALQRLGLSVDLVNADADLGAYKIIVAPTAFMADEKLNTTLTRYVSSGGRLLFGVRSGFKTPSNRVTDKPLPGVFGELVGASVGEWHSLPPGVVYTLNSSFSNLNPQVTFWAEYLTPNEGKSKKDDLKIFARYDSGPFDGHAALTGHQVGEGETFYLGWYPSVDQAMVLLDFLGERSRIPRSPALPLGLTAIQRGDYKILLNFSDQSLTTTISGQLIRVDPRDIRILSNPITPT